MKRCLLLTLFLSLLLLDGSNLSACASDSIVDAIKKVKPGMVCIVTRAEGSTREGGGSGIIISGNGYILTNSHVIKGARTIKVKLVNGRVFSGYVIGAAAERDLAVIRIDCTGLAVPRFGDSSALEIGQTVFAIGNAFQLGGSVTRGIVSALNVDIEANGIHYRDLIQTDAAINPGNSGGALCNEKGEVVGINTAAKPGTSLGFSIPINAAIKIARSLVKSTAPVAPRPWIGITPITLLKETADAYDIQVKHGVLVQEVEPDGPCAKAGIVAGDVITELNGQRIVSIEDFKSMVSGFSPSQIIELTVWHRESDSGDPADLAWRKKTVTVTIDYRSR